MSALQKLCLGLVLCSFVVLSLAYNVLQPIWEAPDESAHFGFVRYVQLHHALPRGSPATPAHIDAWNPTSEYSQAPLYYLVLAVALSPVRLLPDAQFHPNPYVAWPGHPWREAVALHRTDEDWPYHGLSLFVHLGRLISLVFGLVTLLATFGLVRSVTHRVSDALFATAWLAWTPGFLLASARLDNDAAAMVSGTVTVLFCGRLLMSSTRPCWTAFLWPSLGLAAALLSKLDTVFLIPLVATAAIVAAEPRRPLTVSVARRLGATLLTLMVPLGLLAGWWLVIGRTFQARVGTAAGFGVVQIWTTLGSLSWARVFGSLWNLNGTWWGGVGFGALKLWPPVVYILLAIPLGGLVCIGAVALLTSQNWHSGKERARWTCIVFGLSALPLFYATVARQALPSVGLDSNARFTLPAASIVALMLVIGGRYLRLDRWRRPLALGYLLAMLALAVATAALLLPRIPAPRIPARLARSAAELTRPAVATFANGVDLLAVNGLPSTIKPGQAISLDLRWRVDTSPAQNFTAFVHLVGVHDHREVAGSDAIPFQKTFPPRLWQTGEIIDEHESLTVPGDLPPGQYTLLIGGYHLAQNDLKPIPLVVATKSATTVSVGSWAVLPDTAGLAQARPANAAFGPNLVLRGYAVRDEDGYLDVSLYWQARRQIHRRLVVSVQLLGHAGRTAAQNDSEPVQGRLPTTAWPTGAIIRDNHRITLPDKPGDLQTIVVVYDRQTQQRLSVSVAGKPASDHFTLGN